MGFNSASNPLNTELNPICHLLALFEAHHILHVSRIKVNTLIKRIISINTRYGLDSPALLMDAFVQNKRNFLSSRVIISFEEDCYSRFLLCVNKFLGTWAKS